MKTSLWNNFNTYAKQFRSNGDINSSFYEGENSLFFTIAFEEGVSAYYSDSFGKIKDLNSKVLEFMKENQIPVDYCSSYKTSSKVFGAYKAFVNGNNYQSIVSDIHNELEYAN